MKNDFNLENILETEEPVDQYFEEDPLVHELYDIESGDRYFLNPEELEIMAAVEKVHDMPVDSEDSYFLNQDQIEIFEAMNKLKNGT